MAGHGPTVLIVDDHEGFRAFARRALEASGFLVVGEASDAAQAGDAVLRLAPQVVLLDLQLAGEDGLAVASRLAAGPAAPAVVLTSSRDPADYGARLAESGAVGFIPKAELSGESLGAVLDRP